MPNAVLIPEIFCPAASITSIRQIIDEIFETHRQLGTGTLPDYIPELTRANPDSYGIAITTVDGRQYLVGDTAVSAAAR